MLFSIIIPVYNTEKYLKQCLQSVLQQTCQDYEIILIDDGSTDKSGTLCDEYAKIDKVTCVHQKNQGLSAARNTGVAVSRGEYLLFLDSDDYLLSPSALEILAAKANGRDMIEFFWSEIPDGETPDKGVQCVTSYYTWNDYKNGEEYLIDALQKVRFLPWYACMRIYRHKFWDAHQFAFPVGKKYEDTWHTPQVILAAESIAVVPYAVYGYRVAREGSITQVANLSGELDRLEGISRNIQMIQNDSKLSPELKTLMCDNLSCGYYSAQIRAGMMKDVEQKKKILEELKQVEWICDYTLHNPQKSIAKLNHIIGIQGTLILLNLRRKLKEWHN